MISSLEGQEGLESKLLKLDAYWSLKDWKSAAPLAQEVLTLLKSSPSVQKGEEDETESEVKIFSEALTQKALHFHDKNTLFFLTQKVLKASLLSVLYLSGRKMEASLEEGLFKPNKDLLLLLSSKASSLTVPLKDILRKNITQTLKRTSDFIKTFEKELGMEA